MNSRRDAGLVLSTELGGAGGGPAVAAAVCVAAAAAAADGSAAPLRVEVGAGRARGPTVLASAPATRAEEGLRAAGFEHAAARGRLCWLGLEDGDEALTSLWRVVALQSPGAVTVVHLPPALWPEAVGELRPIAGLLRAELPAQRSLAALAVSELREGGARARIAVRPLGPVASRRAVAGLEPGGAASRRIARLARGLLGHPFPGESGDRGQALPLVLGAVLVLVVVALVLTAIGGAVNAAGRVQSAADLAALSGARSLRDDFPRLFEPALRPDGSANPEHLDRADYLRRAVAAAKEAASHNGLDPRDLEVSFPDARSFAPLEIGVDVHADAVLAAPGGRGARPDGASVPVAAHAEAEASPPGAAASPPQTATGGGYAGPLAYRQGKPMRPDVAQAFDRMAAAAGRAGIALVINSAYRSDAEQADLYAANPDPRWVAPPGESLHRCGTELDLGPPSAYVWLEQNADRFGFLQRYPWERWHFGYTRGPPPCSEAGNAIGSTQSRGAERLASQGLPEFVPPQFRAAIEQAAARWNVSAGLLAAQLMAESNFNPFAVSGAGAQGIAQFMPGTARSYGLDDPFDAPRAIDAQAHLMSDLLRQFGSPALALAAYNAGPGAVEACDCVPDIPETQSYVARILGLMGGSGELPAPALEVRLVV